MGALAKERFLARDVSIWDLGGISLREAILLTSMSRSALLARVYSGSIPVSRQGRRIIFPRRFLLQMLADGATVGK
jgi:hypothetical protein